jgi:outer membrane protein TolC
LIPADTPTLVPYRPDWGRSLDEALTAKPELLLCRQELKVRQLELLRAKNLLLPDLRFTSSYEVQGLGSRLDGTGPDNALRSLAQNRFQNWALGLRLEVPIGFREAHAGVRLARLNLASALEVLRDQENKVASALEQRYRQLFELHAQVQAARARREAYGRQLELRYQEFLAGSKVPVPFLLEAQRFWSDALSDEHAFIAQYNTALCGFEYAKGTILNYHHAVIAEGPLPVCARVRAAEHERERSEALVLRERARPVPHAGQGGPGLPQFPAESAPSLPALFAGMGTPPLGITGPTSAR